MCERCGLAADVKAVAKYRADIPLCNRCLPKHQESLKSQNFVIEEYVVVA